MLFKLSAELTELICSFGKVFSALDMGFGYSLNFITEYNHFILGIEMEKLKFPSEEWIKAFKEEVNKNKAYEEAAKDWEGDFLFIATPGDGLEEEVVFYVDLWHGKCREAYMVPSREAKETEFIYEGPYGNWKKLIMGEIGPIRGLLTRKFKLKGSMSKILRYTKAASELVKTTEKVPTEFI